MDSEKHCKLDATGARSLECILKVVYMYDHKFVQEGFMLISPKEFSHAEANLSTHMTCNKLEVYMPKILPLFVQSKKLTILGANTFSDLLRLPLDGKEKTFDCEVKYL